MDEPGAQAAPHTTTAVQSRKSMDSQRKCASTVKTYMPPVAASLQSCAETRGLSAFRSAWQTSGSCPWPCRGGTWLEPAQLSHTFVCLRVQHIPHTHKAGHVTKIPVVTTNGDSWGDKAPGPNATYAIHPLQMSDKLILWGKIKARQSPILITLPLLVRTKRVLLAAMKYWPLKNWFPFHKNL